MHDLLRRCRNLLSHPPLWWKDNEANRERLIADLDVALAEPEERNFCPRCGKRSFPDAVHTCTPPDSHRSDEVAALMTTWVSETEAVIEPLFKAPRRLTDTEVGEVWFAARIPGLTENDGRRLIRAAEARSGAR